MFYFDYSRNSLAASNGISLHDNSPSSAPGCNASTFAGPYIRWVSITGNVLAGVAPSNPGVCASVNATNPLTTDLLVEGNDASACPAPNLLPCGDGVCVRASHSYIGAPGGAQQLAAAQP